MASRRNLKKDIDYLVGDMIEDAHLAILFNSDKKYEKIVAVIEEAVELRNALFARIKPEEKNNRRLVHKHYAALRHDLQTGIEGLFEKLSAITKA